jgi:hypothetical protein
MEQKMKFVLVGLAGFIVVLLFLFFQTYTQKTALEQEHSDLKKENTSLSGTISKLESNIKDYEKKVSSLNKDLESIRTDKKDIEKKYEAAQKAKEELIDQLKSRKAQIEEVSTKQQKEPPAGMASSNDAYWAGVLRQKAELETQLTDVTAQLKTVKIANEGLQREKTSMDLELNDLKRQKDELKRQFEYNKNLMDSIAKDLVRERNDKMQIEETFKAVKTENKALIRQVGSLNNRKIALEEKMQALQQDKASVQGKLKDVETLLMDKVGQIDQFKAQIADVQRASADVQVRPDTFASASQENTDVSLPPIVVRPQDELPAATPGVMTLSGGKVIAVNKDNNFIVIDMGESGGVKLGDTFQVYRDGQSIATIEAIQVRRDIAACDIKRQTALPKIGDMIQ